MVAETANGPVVEGEMPVSVLAALLWRVNVLAALLVPTVVLGKVALAGVKVTDTRPVPLSDTLCGLPAALSVMLSEPVREPIWVGVKVTLILQFLPAARVLPQVEELTAKSPVVPIPLMSSVPLPVLASVTVLAAEVLPTSVLAYVTEAGVSVTTGVPLAAVMVSEMVVCAVMLPEVPVTVTEVVPVVAPAVAVKVSMLVVEVGFGLKPADTPEGRVDVDKVTLPLNPPESVTVMVELLELPCATETELGLAESENPGPTGPARALMRLAPFGLPQPVARSYPVVAA